MKTKFTEILMLLTIAVGMGVIVTSCKDTNEDDYNKLRVEIENSTSLTTALKTQIANLQDQINALKARLDKINDCNCDLSALQRTIEGLQQDVANLKASKADKAEIDRLEGIVNNLLTKYNYIEGLLVDNYVTKNVFETEIARLEKLIASGGNCNCDLNSILNKLSEIENGIIDAKALAQTANSLAESAKATADAAKAAALLAQTAADAAKADAASAKELATAVQKIANSNTESIRIIESQLVTMSYDLQTALTNAKVASSRSYQDSIRIDELEKSFKAMEGTIAKQDVNISNLREDILNLRKDTEGKLAELRSYVDLQLLAVKGSIAGLETDITEIYRKIDALTGTVDGMNTKINNITGEISIINSSIDRMSSNISNLEAKIDRINSELTTKIADVANGLDATNITVGELVKGMEAVKDQLSTLSTKVGEIDEAVKTLTTTLNGVSEKVNELDGKLAALSDVIAKQVTGVIVQGTYNPAFGSFGVPANIQSNVLIAYYGEAENKLTFPVLDGRTLNYITSSEVLTEDEVKNLGNASKTTFTANAGEMLTISSNSNAGKLYLTINPAERDFEGLQLSLENSQGKIAGVKLGTAKKSYKKLDFGWTRAESSENGFYEVPANVEDFEHVQKINVGEEEQKQFKEDVKEILNKGTKTSFVEIAKDIYDVLGHLNMDANAVKVAWNDEQGDHSIRSTYNIAAFAIQPLHFASYRDLNFHSTVPGYEQAMKLIDQLAKKLKKTIDKAVNEVEGNSIVTDFNKLKINTIEMKSYNNVTETAIFAVSFVWDGKDYTRDVEIPFTGDLKINKVNNAIDEVEKLVADVKAELDNINNYKARAYNEIDDYVTWAKSKLEHYNDRIFDYINNINARFQPVMLVGQGETCIPSGAESYPTHVKAGNLGLIPTTWSYELAVPVCKKHIAVVNVTKDGLSYPSIAQKLNQDNKGLNTVLNGDERYVRISGLETGYTYTIAYSALDFAGNISTKRYYVTAD